MSDEAKKSNLNFYQFINKLFDVQTRKAKRTATRDTKKNQSTSLSRDENAFFGKHKEFLKKVTFSRPQGQPGITITLKQASTKSKLKLRIPKKTGKNRAIGYLQYKGRDKRRLEQAFTLTGISTANPASIMPQQSNYQDYDKLINDLINKFNQYTRPPAKSLACEEIKRPTPAATPPTPKDRVLGLLRKLLEDKPTPTAIFTKKACATLTQRAPDPNASNQAPHGGIAFSHKGAKQGQTYYTNLKDKICNGIKNLSLKDYQQCYKALETGLNTTCFGTFRIITYQLMALSSVYCAHHPETDLAKQHSEKYAELLLKLANKAVNYQSFNQYVQAFEQHCLSLPKSSRPAVKKLVETQFDSHTQERLKQLSSSTDRQYQRLLKDRLSLLENVKRGILEQEVNFGDLSDAMRTKMRATILDGVGDEIGRRMQNFVNEQKGTLNASNPDVATSSSEGVQPPSHHNDAESKRGARRANIPPAQPILMAQLRATAGTPVGPEQKPQRRRHGRSRTTPTVATKGRPTDF